ncbi:MAG: hypothetical protein RBT65_08530 [Methanolobus sp.]|nr:hypothetical protein [Methanolobus sp.]
MELNDKAQLHTLEGLAAAVLMTMTVLMITNSTMMVTPQNEMAIDVQLKQMASDALTVIDIVPKSSAQSNNAPILHNLTACVASWDVTEEATYPVNTLDNLEDGLSYLLPNVLYNVDLAYVENGNITQKKVIIKGSPGKSAVVARHFVTLTNQTVSDMNGTWNLDDDELRVVEVRLTAWKV